MSEIKERKLFSKIIKYIDDKEIIVIHGSRQVGKTSLLHYIIDNHLKKISSDTNIFYFDLEDFYFLDLCNSCCDDVVSYLKAKGGDFDKKIYLIIDEVQYLNNPSSFLKLFNDKFNKQIKLIVSGSSSFLIKKRFKDSLAGRILDFELFTLDFEEFIQFKGLRYNLKDDLPEIIHNEIKKLYTEYIIFGGYPACCLEPSLEKKEMKLKQLINTYIKKDIRDLAEIREIDKFNDLLKILASQTANLLNILELSNTLGISKQTIQEYIFLLENTYIIKRIRPFHKNIRSELTKMPKIFFEDTGLANILANKTFFLKIDSSLLENSIYSELRKNINSEDIYFWRTNKKQEIDFIIDYIDINNNRRLIAIEVKNIFLNKYTTNLRYLKRKYNNAETFICSLERKEKKRDKNINIIFPWQLLTLIR
ncbi:MAG: ATP-binding protein [Candidatus Hydrogenedentota bacterium]